MPKFVGLLQDEISRLARKEVTSSQKSLKKTAVFIRKENSELKKRIKSLEKAVELLQKAVGCEKNIKEIPSAEEAKGVKFQARSITTLRKKHGLSVLKMAALMGISNKSLDRWEKGIGSPQTESKKKLLAFKKLSKSEVRKILKELKAKKGKTAEPAKSPATPAKKSTSKRF